MSDGELTSEPTVEFDYELAESVWESWWGDSDDVLARAGFEHGLRLGAGLEDEGLYFRPGGWTVDLPTATVRVAIASAILFAAFHAIGLEDVDEEIVIAAAGLLAAMDIRPVRLGKDEKRVLNGIEKNGLAGTPIDAGEAKKALPKRFRREVSKSDVAEALDRLVAAGLADRSGDSEWILRAKGSEAWIRIGWTGDAR